MAPAEGASDLASIVDSDGGCCRDAFAGVDDAAFLFSVLSGLRVTNATIANIKINTKARGRRPLSLMRDEQPVDQRTVSRAWVSPISRPSRANFSSAKLTKSPARDQSMFTAICLTAE